MKIKIDRHALISKLNQVVGALPVKTTLAILTGIKFVATDRGVSLTGSDSDISINTFIPAKLGDRKIIDVEELGGIVIPGKYFFEIIKKLEAPEIEITVFEGHEILIQGAQGEYTLKGLPAENYPQIELTNVVHQFEMATEELKTLISQTLFSVSTAESRPVLTGVNFKKESNALSASATDSFRLSQRRMPLQTDENFNLTIPGRSLAELRKTLEDRDPITRVKLATNQILFENAETSFQSRLLEGKFPDVNSFIPDDYEIKLTMNYRELFSAVDRVSLMSREDRANVARIYMDPETSELLIKTNAAEVGKIEEVVRIKEGAESKFAIACSAIFLLDALKAIDNTEGDISLGFNGSMKPFAILDLQDENNLQLIVPVRVEDID